jgi:alkanesulfonate monooxygenase SsuD/methylene tetrahydromethanopterin reductase-like flavin-dependent oxidoreductase (luciferase family)
MNLGVQLVIQNHEDYDDRETFQHELRLAIEAEAMGFDVLWPVEHHFRDYSMCPDNMQYLSYVAAKTSTLKLGTGAIIVPWNDPLRVVEKMILLDHLSDGRAVLGLGRGLSRREYSGFRQDMSEARERFNEGAEMIVRGLEEGFVEGNGNFYPQPRVECRPRKLETFEGRRYMVCMSPDSFEVAAELGLGAMMFSQFPWKTQVDQLNQYRADYRAKQGADAPPISIVDFAICDPDVKKAEELARERIVGYLLSVFDHYEMLDAKHFEETGGSYAHYANAAKTMNEMGQDAVMEGFLDANLWGDSARIKDKLVERHELIGDFETNGVFSFQSIPFDYVEKNMRLFAETVGPLVKSF